MRITEIEGDLFDAPDGSILIHACNCKGSWGGGIAKAFQKKFPAAYKIYRDHCKSLREEKISHVITEKGHAVYTSQLPLGTALIIEPQVADYSTVLPTIPSATSPRTRSSASPSVSVDSIENKKHWIVCLFTSTNYGRRVDKPHAILENSVHAIRDMRKQLEKLFEDGEGEDWQGKLYACQFNSGLFHVPWPATRAVLERELHGMKSVNEVIVMSPRKDDSEDGDDANDEE